MGAIVISIGGSVIVPDNIDSAYVKEFCNMIKEKNRRFVIVAGGGSTGRKYIEAAKEIGVSVKDGLDWVGIRATRINAELLRAGLAEISNKDILQDYDRIDFKKDVVVVGGGWKPGFSTDYCAVAAAKLTGAKRVINITDIDHVYDKDPDKFPDAKPIKEIKWDEMLKLVGDEWNPGLHMPFDPIASKEAAESGIEVIIINKEIGNLSNCIDKKEFKGTVIS